MNKIIELYNNLNDQVRYAILVGIIFLIILLDVFFGVLPQMAGIAHVNDQIKKLTDDTQEVLADKPRINLLRKNLKAQSVQLKSMSKKIRTIQEVPVILSTISSIANEFGVKIDQLVPEKNQQEVLVSTPDGKYYALPVVIKARCGYHKFGRFLNKLENGDLYFTLKNFIIQNGDKETNTHLFSLIIKITLVDRAVPQAKSL